MRQKNKTALWAMVSLMMLFGIGSRAGAQKLNNKFSYANLNGVNRLGVNYQYRHNQVYGFEVDYLSVLRNKNTFTTSFSYLQLDKENEECKTGTVAMTYGRYLFNLSKRVYVRGLMGGETGYEYKASKVIDDSRSFVFLGARLGLEPEIFLSQHLVLYCGINEYAHYYIDYLRVGWRAYGGIRISF